MKRKGNLYDQLCSIDNILLADQKARLGKSEQRGVIEFDGNWENNIADIYRDLITKTYSTPPYKTRIIRERKEREISILPYRDRVVQHAIMNILEKMFVATFSADTYSCIKGKGVHKASNALTKMLKSEKGTMYCLKLDVKKFYASVDHEILKQLLRKKIKDKELLWLLDGIIDSAPGLPIGNYLSQYFSNFYLCYFDHWIKEELGVKNYIRYADDIVILADDKDYLQTLLVKIKHYLSANLKLTVKEDHRVFPTELGIDFVGYVHFFGYKRLRKTIKVAFARKVARMNKSRNPKRFKSSIDSYLGWAKHANCKHLIKKLLPHE